MRVRDLVVLEQLEQVMADSRLVVVDEAGGENRHLARRALAVVDDRRPPLVCGTPAKALRRQLGHPGLRVHAECCVHRLAGELGLVHGVHGLHDDRNAGEAAVHVGRGQEALAGLDVAAFELDRLGAQHQVREIELPRMRRRVRTLGHVAQVAQVALVDDVPVGLLLDTVHLAVGRGIDQIEQCRKALAQADAATTAVADVEHALHLLGGRRFIVEVGVLPVDGVPGRGFEVAFAHRTLRR